MLLERFTRPFFILLMPILLSACAIPLRTALPDQTRKSIQTVNMRAVVVQDEVIVSVQPSTSAGAGMAFGLIGALITSSIDSSVTNSRVKSSQEAMEALYPAIDDVDFRKQFGEELSRQMSAYPFRVSSVVSSARGLNDADIQKIMRNDKPGDALLLIYPSYALTGDHKNFIARATMTLWTKGKATHEYRGMSVYQSKPLGTGGVDSLDKWGQNNAAAYRSATQEAIQELVRIVMMDVELKPEAVTGAEKSYAMNGNFLLGTPSVKGKVLSEKDGRITLLSQDNRVYSIPVAQ